MKSAKDFDIEPVTRVEFREVIEELQSHVDDGRAEARTQSKMVGGKIDVLRKELKAEAAETRRFLKVYAENMAAQMRGAFKDAVGNLKERVIAIEHHLGLGRE